MKKFIKKIIYRERASSEELVKYYRKLGMRIGERTCFFSPRNVLLDETRPWLIEIGNDVQITHGVTILTHGYDWAVLKGVYGEVMGSAGKVQIGNNVFIGMNTTILKGSVIGDNCIVGAGSLVRGAFPAGSVIAGNPARVICSIEDYREKRMEAQLNEARELAVEYLKVYGRYPSKEIFHEFFWLFEKRPADKLETDEFGRVMRLVGNEKVSYEHFNSTKGMFDSYEEFLQYCFHADGERSS